MLLKSDVRLTWKELQHRSLRRLLLMVHITDRITHEVAGINRVLYDFTPKPTETVEFE